MDYSPPGFSVHRIFQARILDCHFLLQGIFPTQGSNPGLLHWQEDPLPLNHSASSSILVYECWWEVLFELDRGIGAAGSGERGRDILRASVVEWWKQHLLILKWTETFLRPDHKETRNVKIQFIKYFSKCSHSIIFKSTFSCSKNRPAAEIWASMWGPLCNGQIFTLKPNPETFLGLNLDKSYH